MVDTLLEMLDEQKENVIGKEKELQKEFDNYEMCSIWLMDNWKESLEKIKELLESDDVYKTAMGMVDFTLFNKPSAWKRKTYRMSE